MVVAVLAVRMMQVSRDEVVDVIAVRDGLVATARAVDVTLGVPRAAMRGRARGGVRRVDREGALVDVSVVRTMKVAVMEIVDVVAVANGGVAAGRTVGVIVVRVGAVGHGFFCFPLGDGVFLEGALGEVDVSPA